MKRVLTVGPMFLIMFLISSSGYSQDTTLSPTDNALQSTVKKGKTQSKWEYSVNFTGKKVSGYTEYHIQFPDEIYVTYDGYTYIPYTVTGHSILAFPVDGYRLGCAVNARMNLSKKKALVFELGFSKALSQPQEAMVDTDYIDLKSFGMANWIMGATTSKVDYSNYDLSLMVGYPMLLGKKAHFIPKAGFQTSVNKFDVIGLAGWYEWNYGYPEPVDPYYYSGTTVMNYEVTYNRIVTGVQVKTLGEEGVILSLQAQYFPWVKATDHDDHLLRGKEADTEASGTGYFLEGRIEIPIHTTPTGSVWSLGGGYGLTRITATGDQQQKFYADDPTTAEIETEYVFPAIANTIKLRQNNIIVFVEYKL